MFSFQQVHADSLPNGCIAGDNFSPVTGQPCTISTTCNPGDLFNSQTGKPCGNYLPGCSASTLYSVTTGHKCDGSVPAQTIINNPAPVVPVSIPKTSSTAPIITTQDTYAFGEAEVKDQSTPDSSTMYVNNGTLSLVSGSSQQTYLEMTIYKDGGTVSVDSDIHPIVSITSSNSTVFPEQDVTLTGILYTPTNIGGLSKNIGFYFAEPVIVPAYGQAVPGTYTLYLNAPALNISKQIQVTLMQDPNSANAATVAPNANQTTFNQYVSEIKSKYPNSYLTTKSSLSNGNPGYAVLEDSSSNVEVAELLNNADGSITLNWTDGSNN